MPQDRPRDGLGGAREARDALVIPVDEDYQVDLTGVVPDEAGPEFVVQLLRNRPRYGPPEHWQARATRGRERGFGAGGVIRMSAHPRRQIHSPDPPGNSDVTSGLG